MALIRAATVRLSISSASGFRVLTIENPMASSRFRSQRQMPVASWIAERSSEVRDNVSHLLVGLSSIGN